MNIEKLKQDFDRDGCLIIPGFLDAEELARLELEATKALEGTDLRIVKGMERTNPWFADQLISGKHVALIEALLKDELEPATAAFLIEFPVKPKESHHILMRLVMVVPARHSGLHWIRPTPKMAACITFGAPTRTNTNTV